MHYLRFLLTYSFFLSLGIFLPQLVQAQSPFFSFSEGENTYTLKQKMDAAKVYGISYYIMNGETQDTSFQVGYRDLENQQLVESNTRFQVGSMSAPLVHFAVLRAVDEGLIDLDTKVNDYLEQWQVNWTPLAMFRPLRVRDLLLQTHKFNLGSKPWGYVPGTETPTLLQILNGESPSQEKAVKRISGHNLRGYSSFANVMILQLLLEETYEQPLSTIIEQKVLQPLGMSDSRFVAELSSTDQATSAVGYDKQGKRIEGDRWVYPEVAAVGLWSTPRDYARFVWHVMQAAKGKDNRFLSQEMALAGISPDKKNRALIFYATPDLYWGGASMGFRTQFRASIDQEWVAVCFMNSHENWRFMASALYAAEKYARANATDFSISSTR
ncbi:MAG: serine hydrolase domain-containing protein [Bacteroidota bacterium]